MTGLEKIIEKINADNELKCSSIIDSAGKQCDDILKKAEENGKKEIAAAEENAKKEYDRIIAMAGSGAAQQSRQILLGARVDAVNEAIAALTKVLGNLPDDVYFDSVIRIAEDNAMKGECTARINSRDAARLPDGFEEKLKTALARKGAVCTLSGENAEISSGILLDYGDIVVNCSFEAVTEDNIDNIKQIISGIIF